jgi:putative FmdB family regulatory protein
MPIFEYQCGACDHRFERLFLSAGSAKGEIACPECGAAGAEKLFSTFGVRGSAGDPRPSAADVSCGRCGQNRPPCGS